LPTPCRPVARFEVALGALLSACAGPVPQGGLHGSEGTASTLGTYGTATVADAHELPAAGIEDKDTGLDSGGGSGDTQTEEPVEDRGEWMRIDADPLPPRFGRAEGAASLAPGVRRMHLATSPDGLNFTRAGVSVLDQSNSPSIVELRGRTLVYSTMHQVDGLKDGTAVSALNRNGTWSTYKVEFRGLPGTRQSGAVESYAYALEDRRVRLYFGMDIDGVWAIHAATSDDGIVFQYDGESVPSNGYFGDLGGYIDPIVAVLDGTWHMLLADSGTQEGAHALSTDGLHFEVDSTFDLWVDSTHHVLSNWIDLDKGARVYTSTGLVIGSTFTTDGVEFEIEPGDRLAPSAGVREGDFVQDGAVKQMSDGSYWMIYVTEIPE
jgi:hypothetical protein